MCLVGAALVLAANPLMKSSAVLQQLLDDASMNVLSDLCVANLWRRACSSLQGGQPLDERGFPSDHGSGPRSWNYSAFDWLATCSTRPAVASMSLGGRRSRRSGQLWRRGCGCRWQAKQRCMLVLASCRAVGRHRWLHDVHGLPDLLSVGMRLARTLGTRQRRCVSISFIGVRQPQPPWNRHGMPSCI